MNKIYRSRKIALVVPCYNEEMSIATVISQFRESIPEADIYVFDNNSKDKTALIAKEHNVHVHTVSLKGKGNVVRRMFSDVEADVYIMVDGDATYDASAAKKMVDKLIDDKLDMVVGCRQENGDEGTYRQGHRFGNKMLTGTVTTIFKGEFSDMLSGYRVFSRRYVKSFPCLSRGFEIETELTIHALELRMRYGEVQTSYGERPEGSTSKLSTYKDGIKILKTIIKLYMSERPFYFFLILSILFVFLSIILGFPILAEFEETGLVPRFPTAILASAIMTIGIISFVCGIILESVTMGRREMKALFYLNSNYSHENIEDK
ncbi:glycosyltransferase family 2 protein [Pantoea sp. BAV 3049]|uniref:glycosyltransferase family 2 protein n=1 Tax=Pantoea sp. BAV 3049 TaxID=2654188 RepID=UPI00131A6FA6|nr:glycosyltransferase family 2 protein [Pantoea sp. BAV 3049]